MKKLTLDPHNTLVNVGNSILSFFGVTPFHSTYEPLDRILKTTKKDKIALILLDGMGRVILDHYKDDAPFLYEHIYKQYKSVFPPTTVAATTALTTGKYPIETCYLGWSQYFETRKAFINVFISNDNLDHSRFFTPRVTDTELKTDFIWDLINKTLKHNAVRISSFDTKLEDGENDFEDFFKRADETVKNYDFSYIYSTNPDHLLHVNGRFNDVVKENMIYLNNKVKELVENNPDVLFLLTADHGFEDIVEIPAFDHEDFNNTLERQAFSIEPRFATFFVKDHEKFLELANKYYGEDFIIKSKQEILDEHTFGYGEINEKCLSTIGDYTLIAKGNKAFYQREAIGFNGTHAGINDDETDIYLLVFNQ